MTKGYTRILTVRMSAPLERRLKERARSKGRTPSEHVRALLQQELALEADDSQPTLYERAHELIGSLSGTTMPDGAKAKAHLRRHFRPDRRG